MRSIFPALVLLAVAIPVHAAAAPSGPVPINPNSWTIPSSYPPDSQPAKAQGVVAFRLAVSRDGIPTSCTVTEQSGAADLDRQTCEWLLKRARFRPALDSTGAAVAGHYETRFGWTLKPDGLAPLPAPGSLTMTAVVEADGRITDCKVEREGMQPGGQFDTWCGDLQSYQPVPDAGGKVVRRRLILKRSLSLEEMPAGSEPAPASGANTLPVDF